MPKRVAEFFAGIGLMRMGLDREGWTTVWANDLDEKKQEMYEHNFSNKDCEFVLEDVHKIDSKDIPDIELATASFPCNDLSLAGARHGLAGSNSSAFWGFIASIKGMGKRRPPLVLLENVAGFLTSNNGNDFRDALLALNDLGYAVDAFILDAVRFVPQSRVRLFVVGSKAKATRVQEASLALLQSDVRPPALADFIFMNPDIGWSVRSLPSLPPANNHLADIIEDVPLNSELWWSKERCEYLLNQMSDKHLAEAKRMIAGSKLSYGTVFRRVRNGRSMGELRTDGIAGCLRTPRGGSGRQILFCAGKGQYRVRLLTPLECARLMGANGYKINVPLNQALFGFGDAVCVPAVQWIASNYLNPLLDEMMHTPMPLPSARKQVHYTAAGRRITKSKA
ncbi:DNA cytosine methyltransferase [Prosthecobacter vanneervenii]|uniref:DNA (cytosine-5-)-methyltransferase n=1 Tax=Prosthecobacter vanneervenii TaxID=48466 RepID=A0A7W7Y848_9BACT|nr:DNA (cytosine-5-)-methyltransferase [Prosthecobacter vanneervenii]MBB5031344.1 DNA (cytosine-5)-methyltransferase 1 [Prosthecobacter vanneervenii]